MSASPIFELRGVGKSFPGVRALADLSLQFAPGEIHALLGENGAGKSTAMKILAGLQPPDEGEVWLDDAPVRFRSARDSMARGVHLVFQELQLVPEASIAENVMLDKLPRRSKFGVIDWREVNRRAAEALARVGLAARVSTPVKNLGAAQKQFVQIARALAAHARILLLDEPTSYLGGQETQRLLELLRELRAQGVTIIYVSHKIEEVFAVCDRVSVLRDGALVRTARIAELTPPELVRLMIGREASVEKLGVLPRNGRERLRAEHLTRAGKVRGVSFSVHDGEILGFYGLVGAGRSETARLIIGDDPLDGGQVFVDGQPVRIRNVREGLRRFGIGYVTENRKEDGLWLSAPVVTNLCITIWEKLARRWTGRVSAGDEATAARQQVIKLSIKCSGLQQETRLLSGGNQQKICIGKWLAAGCQTLIIDEPTAGVDIGAKEQIHALIHGLAANEQRAVIVISSDLMEIIKLASRILVFRAGRIAGEIRDVDAPGRTYEEISRAIGSYLN
jgi:ribose transport system ATP-binding protein